MLINNPQYTLRLIDLIDTSGFKAFDYFELYEKTHQWLDDLKVNFYDDTEWDTFIERFCDRYYMRSFNFNTYLEFKLQLKVTIENIKENAHNLATLKARELDVLADYQRVAKFKESNESKGSSNTTATAKDSSTGSSERNDNGSSSNSTFNYNLYSDTPSDTVNVTDIASGKNANYITNATNDKTTGSNTNKNQSSTKDSVDRTSSSSTGTSNNDFYTANKDELVNEIHGNYFEFVEKMKMINTDIIKFYLDSIEDAQLFSNVLY